jgi:hypothetical protein
MKYSFLILGLLCASHGFAMQKSQPPTPVPTSSTPLIQKTPPKTSIIIALVSGMSPTNAIKKMFYDRIDQ